MPHDEFGLLKNVFGVEEPTPPETPAELLSNCCDGRGCGVCNSDGRTPVNDAVIGRAIDKELIRRRQSPDQTPGNSLPRKFRPIPGDTPLEISKAMQPTYVSVPPGECITVDRRHPHQADPLIIYSSDDRLPNGCRRPRETAGIELKVERDERRRQYVLSVMIGGCKHVLGECSQIGIDYPPTEPLLADDLQRFVAVSPPSPRWNANVELDYHAMCELLVALSHHR